MAKFTTGNSLSKGRPKGSINKRSQEFITILEQHNFNTPLAMMDIYKIAMAQFVDELELVAKNVRSPMESEASKYLKIAQDTLSDIASYTYPKLKAIEQIKIDPLKDMSPDQRLTAMKQAVKMLELQVKETK